MGFETRRILVESEDGSYKKEFVSIKKACQELFGGTSSGSNKIQYAAVGRTKWIYCEKLNMKLKVRYLD